jgi:hypothetical protein
VRSPNWNAPPSSSTPLDLTKSMGGSLVVAIRTGRGRAENSAQKRRVSALLARSTRGHGEKESIFFGDHTFFVLHTAQDVSPREEWAPSTLDAQRRRPHSFAVEKSGPDHKHKRPSSLVLRCMYVRRFHMDRDRCQRYGCLPRAMRPRARPLLLPL